MKKNSEGRKVLTTKDFVTPFFDINPPVRRQWEGKVIIEGVTRTNNFKVVGYTYWPGNGRLVIKDTLNQVRFQGTIKNLADFGKAMKKADVR